MPAISGSVRCSDAHREVAVCSPTLVRDAAQVWRDHTPAEISAPLAMLTLLDHRILLGQVQQVSAHMAGVEQGARCWVRVKRQDPQLVVRQGAQHVSEGLAAEGQAEHGRERQLWQQVLHQGLCWQIEQLNASPG